MVDGKANAEELQFDGIPVARAARKNARRFMFSASARLHDYLHSEIKKLELVDAEEPFQPYFHGLAPWLRSDEEKTLRAARQIRHRLEHMRRKQETQGELLQQILSLLEGSLAERHR